jgi:hypothetical protein
MQTTKLKVDNRKRIVFGDLLPDNTSSVRVYKEGSKIILEPFVEIPAHELWLMQNPEALARLKTALNEQETHDLGSFAQFADLELSEEND